MPILRHNDDFWRDLCLLVRLPQQIEEDKKNWPEIIQLC
jgi:hypothetical protein